MRSGCSRTPLASSQLQFFSTAHLCHQKHRSLVSKSLTNIPDNPIQPESAWWITCSSFYCEMILSMLYLMIIFVLKYLLRCSGTSSSWRLWICNDDLWRLIHFAQRCRAWVFGILSCWWPWLKYYGFRQHSYSEIASSRRHVQGNYSGFQSSSANVFPTIFVSEGRRGWILVPLFCSLSPTRY